MHHDQEEYDVVELNPDAVRLGLTQSKVHSSMENTLLMNQQTERESKIFNQTSNSTNINGHGKNVETLNKETQQQDFFGIVYKPTRNPVDEVDQSYQLPKASQFEEDAEVDEEILKSLQKQKIKNDDDFDYEFDDFGGFSTPVEISAAPPPAPPTSAEGESTPNAALKAILSPDPSIFTSIQQHTSTFNSSLESLEKETPPITPVLAVPGLEGLDTIAESDGDEEEAHEDSEDSVTSSSSENECDEPVETLITNDPVPDSSTKTSNVVEEYSEEYWDSLDGVATKEESRVCILPIIHFEEAIRLLKPPVPPEPETSTTSRAKFSLFSKGKTTLPKNEIVIFLYHISFDWNQELHRRIIGDLYRILTEAQHVDDSCGAHWESIGFQGGNPATDLRGTGLYGILQMIWLGQKDPAFCHRILSLSRVKSNEFPMMATSLNFTLICTQSLSHGKVVKANDAVDATNVLFESMWRVMIHRWESEKLTLFQFPSLLADLKKTAMKQPQNIVKMAKVS